MIGLHNIARYIDHQAAERPEQDAVIFPASRGGDGRYTYERLTYAQLRGRVDAYAHGFTRMGFRPGDRVSVFLKPSLDFPAVMFGLFKAGLSPVLIDPGMGRKQALSCIERMAPRGLAAISVVHALSPFFASTFRSVELRVTAGPKIWWGGRTLKQMLAEDHGPFEAVERDPDEEAAILFTSGSTGPAKGVVYSHRIYDAQVRYIQEMYGMEAGEVELAGFPPFALFAIAMGVTAVFADVNPMKVAAVDPSAIVQQIQDHGAQSAFASPALWKPVARYCTEKGVKLPSLRRVMSAGAPIPVWLHEAFQQILEGAEVHTPYGATESLPVATVGSRAVLGETGALTREGRGTCVGVPAPGITIRVIRITDDPIPAWSDDLVLPDGEVGEICVSGEVVTREYRDEPEANKEAKIHEGDRIWHRIGDLGYFDDQGRLWFCGRKAHRVRAANKLLFSAALEGVLNEAPGVARTALVGVGQPGAQEPIIVVELESGADRAAVERDVLARAAANPVTEPIQRVLFHPAFPVDVRHNAKIKREILAEWAAGQLA